METWQGALSVLFAAVAEQAVAGNIYEPEENGFGGYPSLTPTQLQNNALNENLDKSLW
ncbi:hypothetical protein [Mucilaginibacter limnophilus]|uniref:hypothetical protein n=1 Tax=Mucilaginibacter limnophilus TaxID=1932778 RepID=UPI0013E3E6F5|nr:hypothetical protein [Mucilaginibacter limnophilus]